MRAESRGSPCRGDAGREHPGKRAGRRFRFPRGRCRAVSRNELAVLRADYPGYKIWREITPGRERYIARSLHCGLNPHTVVTEDLSELRDVLQPAGNPDLPAFTTARANIARMYSHWLGGKDSFAADRAAADAILDRFPEVANVARANRAFLARAVRHVARQGVSQFIDAGAGLP